MITKKLGKIVFGWNESALKGKGWWYVMGKDDSFSRAASRKEASKLGIPKEQDKPPKDAGKQKYYYDINKEGKPIRRRIRTGSGYEEADITGRKGLMQLASERMMGGQGVMGSLGGAIGDKVMSKVTRIKRAFDPMNLLNKIPGVGKLAATAYGMKRGRSAEDISYFTGVQAPPEMQQEQAGDESPGDGGGGDTGEEKTSGKLSKVKDAKTHKILGDLYSIFQQKFEEDKKLRELDDAFKEEEKAESDRRHKELIDAILKGIKPKENKDKDKKESKSLFDKLLGFFGMIKTSIGNILTSLMGTVTSVFKKLWPIVKMLGGKMGGILKSGLIAGALGYTIDAGLGALGVGKDKEGNDLVIDKEMDDKNWNRMSTPQKIESAIGRGIEKAGKLFFLDNVVREAQAERIKAETEYLDKNPNVKRAPQTFQTNERRVDQTFFQKAPGESDSQYKDRMEKWAKEENARKAKGQSKVTKVSEPVYEQKSYEFLANEPVIPGQPLSPTQMAVAKMSNKLSPEAQKSYDLAKQLEAQPSELGQRVSAATAENQSLTGPAAQAAAPVVVNKTTNVVNNGGAGGGGGSGSLRNDEPVLTRLQYQTARPV